MAAFVVGIATGLISIVSSGYTIVIITREWKRRYEFTKELFDVHQREIEVLHKVIGECQEIAKSAIHIPDSIEDSFKNCATRETDLLKLVVRQQEVPSKLAERMRLPFLAETVRFSLLKKDIKRRYNMYRESVVLLRELCSELRTQQQLVEMSAGMTRLAYDVLDEENEMDNHDQAHRLRPLAPGQAVQNRLTNALDQLGRSNYVINATVVVERSSQGNGQRFDYLSATAMHSPALVKLDTGSDVDVVSLEFLTKANFATSALVPIPDEAKDTLVGVEGTLYQPNHSIELYWFRQGEQQIRRTKFYVVSGAPVDILLGSKRFAQEAAKRVALFTNNPKPKATLDREREQESGRLREAARAEEARVQEELAKRQARNRHISQSANAVPDVEQGATTSTT